MSGPHAFSLRQLQYAVAVADALSFRKAAAQCHVSQPSLSAQVAQLERGLGGRIFERGGRRVLLTPAGEELVEQARAVLREADALAELAARSGDPLSGRLRAGILPTISAYLLPQVTRAVRRAYPKLSLLWVEDKTATLVRALHAGTLDTALVALEAELGDVESVEIARDEFVLAAAHTQELGRKGGPVALQELHGAPVLLLEDGHCLREQALTLCTKAKASELEFRATSLPTLVQMVAAGGGVTLLPELTMATELRRARLRVRRFARPAPYRTLALVWRRGSPLGPALRRLGETIRAAYPIRPRPRGRASSS
jgi:LysR family transcriptional regulator, hydrogen peroxide-inducible genes activator